MTDSVKLSIERALLKSEAIYPYIESLNKSFIIQAGQNCFIKENIFGTEPIRRLTLCMVKNSLFRSTPLNETPFSYQKFNLQRVEIQRGNGVPLAGTPLDTTNNVRLYYNTITALGFKEKSNGIKLEKPNRKLLASVAKKTAVKTMSKNLPAGVALRPGGGSERKPGAARRVTNGSVGGGERPVSALVNRKRNSSTSISRKTAAKRSRSNILSEIQYSN